MVTQLDQQMEYLSIAVLGCSVFVPRQLLRELDSVSTTVAPHQQIAQVDTDALSSS